MPIEENALDPMTDKELRREMFKREDSLDHLMAKAEVMRRTVLAQLRTATYTLYAALAAAAAALIALATTILNLD
jgi:hypothetical protein